MYAEKTLELLIAKYKFNNVLDIGFDAGEQAQWLRDRGKTYFPFTKVSMAI
jgi:hypothetical protein